MFKFHRIFHADYFLEDNDVGSDDSRHFTRGSGDWRINTSRYGLNTAAVNEWAYHTMTHTVTEDFGLRLEITLEFTHATRDGGVYFLHSSTNQPNSNGNGYGVIQRNDDIKIYEVIGGAQTQRATAAYAVAMNDTVYYYITVDYDGSDNVIEVRASKVSIADAKGLAATVSWTDSASPFTSGDYFHLWVNDCTAFFHEFQAYWTEHDLVFEGSTKHILTRGASTFRVVLGRDPDTGTSPYAIRDEIRIFSQDANDNDVLKFEGYIEEIMKTARYGAGFAMIITGRDFRGELLDRLVVHNYENVAQAAILKDIILTYSEHLTPVLDAAAAVISRYFKERNAYEAILDIAEENGFYVWMDPTTRQLAVSATFRDTTATVKITTDSIGGKVIADEVPLSMNQLINRVKVYGDNKLLPQPSADQSDATSVASFGTREYLITDQRVQTNAECQSRADYYKDKYKDQVDHMSVDVFGYESTRPGDLVEVTSTMQNLSADAFLVLEAEYDIIRDVHHFEMVRGTAGAPATAVEIHRNDFEKVERKVSERAAKLEAHWIS